MVQSLLFALSALALSLKAVLAIWFALAFARQQFQYVLIFSLLPVVEWQHGHHFFPQGLFSLLTGSMAQAS
jgi:hypothetical protein